MLLLLHLIPDYSSSPDTVDGLFGAALYQEGDKEMENGKMIKKEGRRGGGKEI